VRTPGTRTQNLRNLLCTQEAPLPPTNCFRLQVRAVVHELRREHDVRVVALRFSDQAPGRPDRDGMRLVSVPRALRVHGVAHRPDPTATGNLLDLREFGEHRRAAMHSELERFRPDEVHVWQAATRRRSGATSATGRAPGALDAAHLNAEAR
jgi:hypothetical protein